MLSYSFLVLDSNGGYKTGRLLYYWTNKLICLNSIFSSLLSSTCLTPFSDECAPSTSIKYFS